MSSPHGILLPLYPSYFLLVILLRYEAGLIDQLLKYKLVFIETTDAAETSLALDNYVKVAHYRIFK